MYCGKDCCESLCGQSCVRCFATCLPHYAIPLTIKFIYVFQVVDPVVHKLNCFSLIITFQAINESNVCYPYINSVYLPCEYILLNDLWFFLYRWLKLIVYKLISSLKKWNIPLESSLCSIVVHNYFYTHSMLLFRFYDFCWTKANRKLISVKHL